MQATNLAAMQDTCVVRSCSRSLDAYGAAVESFTDGAPVACGVEMTSGKENRRKDMNVERIDATIRIPLGTVIKAADHIKVTYRFGVAAAQEYEIIGEIRRGPAGYQVDVQELVP